MADRPVTTLFIIESVDGKISTGDNDELDVDKDFKRIKGVKEGLHQYYELESKTDFFSLNTGRVMAKIGLNEQTKKPAKMEKVSFVVIDNKPHLNKKGVEYLAKWVKTLYLVTTNKNHPAHDLSDTYKNIEIIEYINEVDLSDLLSKMKSKYGVKRITIQSGGTLNSYWLRLGLIDNVSIVVAPCLIGGTNTQSLIGGESLHNENDLKKIKALKLKKCEILKNSYLHIKYAVVNQTQIDL
ncbi:MAG TPA: dihydrofolate reductase family protein [Candidatus Limnocylindrales bacterium]|nr:dihydrofolate reductase family protein [Candidatus Limnocylindrales bacterium]